VDRPARPRNRELGLSGRCTSTVLADRLVGDAEVPQLRDQLYQDGQLDLDDVKLLVELYCRADARGPAFEELLFAVLEKVLLEDGAISPAEQFYLLKLLYSDGHVRARERKLLERLRKKVARSSPEFDALCQTALKAADRDWDLGGR
jgi:hypothetical protein